MRMRMSILPSAYPGVHAHACRISAPHLFFARKSNDECELGEGGNRLQPHVASQREGRPFVAGSRNFGDQEVQKQWEQNKHEDEREC